MHLAFPSKTPVALMLAAALLAACLALSTRVVAADTLYTCGMHPQIVRKAPGSCPICGMNLEPIRQNSNDGAAGHDAHKIKYYKSTMIAGQTSPTPAKDTMGMEMVPVFEDENTPEDRSIHIDTVTLQRMNLKTALVGQGPVKRSLRLLGTVAYNEEGFRDVTTKYEAWVEKTYVGATWTAVKPGDPLVELYSPELYNAQLNYLVALKSEGPQGGPLTRSSLARLQLYDAPAALLAHLAANGEARRTLTLKAPVDGVVVEKMAVTGQMMKPGERLYRLADISTVWIHAQAYEHELPFIKPGQKAKVALAYDASTGSDATVALILPQLDEQTRSATLRLVVKNPDGALRPGTFATVTLEAQLSDDAVLVPDTAVLRSGEHNTVFVALEGGSFEPREIKLGNRGDGNVYEVLDGLGAGERVVTSGQFLLDSESQLREAIQKMLKAEAENPAGPAK